LTRHRAGTRVWPPVDEPANLAQQRRKAMAPSNVEVMRLADEAMNAGDIPRFMSYYADDVKLHARGRNKLAGDYEGKDRFMEVFGRFMEAVGDYSFENHAYLADGEHGVILQKAKCQRGGKTLEIDEAFVMHFRDGKIAEMWYMPVDQAAMDDWIGQ
jgi:ketosteroid isomerase-like protein